MQREQHLISLNIHLDNPIQPSQYGLPVSATTITLIRDANGQPQGYPVHTVQPLIPADVTPELLAALNTALTTIGLQLAPLEASPHA